MRFFFLSCLITLSCTVYAQSAKGVWLTINDQTGKAESHIEITEIEGKLTGRIIKVIDPEDGLICKTCSGKRKNQPYIGMAIITEAESVDTKEWEGQIYDPETDAVYKLIMWIEEDPDVLFVRGKHWTGIYRTQTWNRYTD